MYRHRRRRGTETKESEDFAGKIPQKRDSSEEMLTEQPEIGQSRKRWIHER